MKFFASVADRVETDRVVASLVIDAPTWHDANQYAARALGAAVSALESRPIDVLRPSRSELRVTQTGDEAGADIEIRWVGTDAGSTQGRHREVRVPGGEWTRDGELAAVHAEASVPAASAPKRRRA